MLRPFIEKSMSVTTVSQISIGCNSNRDQCIRVVNFNIPGHDILNRNHCLDRHVVLC